MPVTLVPKEPFKVLVDAKCITPDEFAGKSLEDIGALEVYEGAFARKLSDLFEIKGSSAENLDETQIVIEGDVWRVCRIGENMSGGSIIINGSAGHYVGRWMKGGRIEVKGNVRSWLGAEMEDGTIEVFGNAGSFVGGRLRGKVGKKGMKKGLIIIHGSVGARVGHGMVKGNIIVDGNSGVFPGSEMMGGKILIRGNCDGKAGANMTGGTIIICGKLPSVLPGFYIDDIASKAKIKKEKIEGPFYVFVGDALASRICGGRLYIHKASNPHLKMYEELLEEV
ncbi:MAG TPA: formylmethanofuran dehydrogenase subunit C [Candidatus Korarchaeota archaeon]|nr:formylmethanofuran dehydrogenase subunit C [Candidatus Korarchaeota archaeon]